jgi:hypothetical protein
MSTDRYIFLTTAQDNWQPHPYSAVDHAGIESYIDLNRHKDTYITPNEFKDRTSNTKDNIAVLKAIVLDFDDHWQGMSLQQAQALVGLMQDRFNKDIPNPYQVVYTGRGLHFYVRIQDTTDIALYDLVARNILEYMDKVVGEYEPMLHVSLQADKAAINGNRFYRAPGTYNTKAQAYATGIYSSGATYSLEALINDFVPDLSDITAGKTTAQAMLAKSTGMVFKGYRKEFTAQSWRYAALDDLKALQTKRNDNPLINGQYSVYNNANAGKRNNMLFYFGLLAKHAFNDTQEVYNSMVAFNAFYGRHAKSEQEVQATYRSVINHAYKPPKTATLIKTLDIQPEEMQDLKVVIDRAEVQRRHRIRANAQSKARTTKRTIAKRSVKAQAQAMHATGATYRAIADTLQISIGSAHNYCKGL